MKCNSCGGKVKFKSRYILGVGYPIRNTPKSTYTNISLAISNSCPESKVILNLPEELSLDTPKYRLVLERI